MELVIKQTLELAKSLAYDVTCAICALALMELSHGDQNSMRVLFWKDSNSPGLVMPQQIWVTRMFSMLYLESIPQMILFKEVGQPVLHYRKIVRDCPVL